MEMLYAGRLGELVERLGYHALRGELWSKAAAYLHQSGVKAAGRSSHRDAVRAFEQAVEALRHLPESREVLEAAVDVRCDLRNSLQPLGELATAFVVLQEAEPLARRLEDRRRLGWVSAYMSNYLWVTGRSDDARTFAETAREIGDSGEDLGLRVMANVYLGFIWYTAGDLDRAQAFLEDNLSKLAGDLGYERFGLNEVPAVLSRAILSTLFGARGEFRAAIACAEEGLRIAEALDHAYSRISAAWALGMLHTDKGEPDRALHFLEHALDLCRRGSIAYMEPFVLWSLATAYAVTGRVEDGVALMEHAVPTMEAMGFSAHDMRGFSPTLSFGWGTVSLLAGRLDDARGFAEAALRLATERGARCNEAWAFQLLGDVACEGGGLDLDAGVTHYRQAMALAVPLGLRPLSAHAHFGLGRAHARAGKSDAAREHLGSAMQLYREMDMRSWLESAARELNALA